MEVTCRDGMCNGSSLYFNVWSLCVFSVEEVTSPTARKQKSRPEKYPAVRDFLQLSFFFSSGMQSFIFEEYVLSK